MTGVLSESALEWSPFGLLLTERIELSSPLRFHERPEVPPCQRRVKSIEGCSFPLRLNAEVDSESPEEMDLLSQKKRKEIHVGKTTDILYRLDVVINSVSEEIIWIQELSFTFHMEMVSCHLRVMRRCLYGYTTFPMEYTGQCI